MRWKSVTLLWIFKDIPSFTSLYSLSCVNFLQKIKKYIFSNKRTFFLILNFHVNTFFSQDNNLNLTKQENISTATGTYTQVYHYTFFLYASLRYFTPQCFCIEFLEKYIIKICRQNILKLEAHKWYPALRKKIISQKQFFFYYWKW